MLNLGIKPDDRMKVIVNDKIIFYIYNNGERQVRLSMQADKCVQFFIEKGKFASERYNLKRERLKKLCNSLDN